MRDEIVTGFDIGGAHLKLAQVTRAGRVLAVVQVPCRLWEGLDRLEAAIGEAQARLAPITATAVTMTGELTDLFPDRASGVHALLELVRTSLPKAEHRVWAGRLGFIPLEAAPSLESQIASTNWLASASLAARQVGEGLFVDFGSTTTDILLLAGGRVAAQGLTDRDRLASGELVYTGLTRTPLMAVAAEAPFEGRRVPLMNEYFATTADIYRVLGRLPEHADQHATADGGPKTIAASCRRLARMIGADAGDGTAAAWRQLARWFARRQMVQIEDAIALQLSRGLIGETAPLVGAGCGRLCLAELAEMQGRSYRDFGELVESEADMADWAATCAPAVAVALLRAGEPDHAGSADA